MPKRHQKKNPQRKKAPAKQVTQARADAEPGDDIDPSELVGAIGERERTWVERFRERLEKERMVVIAMSVHPLGTPVALELLIPEIDPLPCDEAIEATLLRVAADGGPEFAPRSMVILTDQRRCKAKFELAR